MNRLDLENGLMEYLKHLTIIDAHEHLMPEKEWLKIKVDAVTFFSHYNRFDLVLAGLKRPKDPWAPPIPENMDSEKRWKLVKPFVAYIRSTTYMKASFIALKHYYGFDEFTDATVGPITAAISKAHKKGIYEKIFRDCRIESALTQCAKTKLDNKRLVPLMPAFPECDNLKCLTNFYGCGFRCGRIASLDDYENEFRRYVRQVKREGAVGVKTFSEKVMPDRKKAEEAFREVLAGKTLQHPNPLKDYIFDRNISIAAEEGLVIAVHSGYWGDFRTVSPVNMIDIALRHPEATFDLYHLGYPEVREAIQVARNFPNVYLNLAWNHIVSETVAVSAIDELIDQIPANKILGFGGDYRVPEKIYGHLTIARRNFAKVFAKRILAGDMTEKHAMWTLKRWLYTNPKELYSL